MKFFRLLLPTLFFFIATLSGAHAYTPNLYDDCERGNEIVATVERPLPPFAILEVSGDFTVNVTSGARAQKLSITADENLIPLISTISQGSKMTIYPERPLCSDIGIVLNIQVNSFYALIAAGSDSIKISNINTGKFSLMFTGNGDVTLQGIAQSFDADIPGSGELIAQELKAKEVSITMSGNGVSNIFASETLKVTITGISDINYFGQPKVITKEIIGIGSLNEME
ncbi:MAG: DUF2807 domain-containing protein [Proteobacteria bacterium]|nr:DUF2807 domain-containing protein [Pseudomonadota bacterium]MBU1686753.1 DUF2807 domain-containing protein [Pseudomonadota bacterium]